LLLSSKNSDQFPLYKDLEAHFAKVIGESSNSNAQHIHMLPYALVGGAIAILKNMKVNGKHDIPYIMEKK